MRDHQTPAMTILAIESSCDETAAAVVRDGHEILSNVISSQIDVHQATGGVVPEVAARLQLETILPVIDSALAKAKLDWPTIDAVAVTVGPGLMGSLLVGVETAKTLAYAHAKPLIGVNHLAAHLYACLKDVHDFRFPYVGLVVSGGHTELVLMESHHRFRLLGSTRDDAAGEAFDKVGKLLGLDYPAGPAVSDLAKRGDPDAAPFPTAMLDQDNYDFSFSGMKTAARQLLGADPPGKEAKENIAAAFQQAVVKSLVGKTLKAVHQFAPSAVLLGGGVAANQSLRDRLKQELQEGDCQLLATPPELATDNAAMIGLAAYWQRETAVRPSAVFSVSADPGLALAA